MKALGVWWPPLVVAAALASAAGEAPAAPEYKVEEIMLGDLNPAEAMLVYSSDRLHVACAVGGSPSGHVLLDGQPARGYDGLTVHALALGPDGKRLAVMGYRSTGAALVVDGKEWKGFFSYSRPVLSPDGKHWACVATKPGTDQVLHDGRPGARYESVQAGSLVFSPDGNRLAYCAAKGRMDQAISHVVVDGKEGPPFKLIEWESISFSPNSKHLAYKVSSKDGRHFVVDDQLGPAFRGSDFIRALFSADGEHWLYPGDRDRSSFVFLDGKPLGEVRGLDSRSILFSPDGAHVWYLAEGQLFLDQQVDPKMTALRCGCPSYSPDGKRLAFVGEDKLGSRYVVMDGVVSPNYRDIVERRVFFSPDSRRVVYFAQAQADAGTIAVVDGEPGPRYWGVLPNSLVFSPDSKRVAFAARAFGGGGGASWLAEVDGKAGPRFAEVGEESIVFSADGSNVAYTAAVETPRPKGGKDRREFVVLNGQPGPVFDRLPGPVFKKGPAFREDGSLEYLGLRGAKLFRVRHVPAGAGWQ